MGRKPLIQGYQNLANAIIIQSVYDYRREYDRLIRNPENIIAKQNLDEVKRFFNSDYYKTLTKIDAPYIMRKTESLINKKREKMDAL